MFKDIEAARGILYRACLTANPFPDPFMAAAAKVFCNEMSLRVTSELCNFMAGSVSRTSIRCRGSTAALATARLGAARRKPSAT